eukprot:2734102-Alexandrium_andersonii.AAC.1
MLQREQQPLHSRCGRAGRSHRTTRHINLSLIRRDDAEMSRKKQGSHHPTPAEYMDTSLQHASSMQTGRRK